MNRLLLVGAVAVSAAVAQAPAHADPLYTETFENAPLSNAHYDAVSTITNTGLEVTAGVGAIFDGGPGQGHALNLFSGWYSPNFGYGSTETSYSTVSSLATFDLIAGYTYTLSYDYSRGFGSGGNGPFPTSLIASFGSHSATYDDVAGFYYGFDWQAGTVTFVQAPTELGAHLSFSAVAPAGYSSMAIDNISLVGLAPAIGGSGGGSGGGDLPGGSVPAVPEPETYAMMLAGLGAVGFMSRRRKR
jgi:hypothetical protein